MTFDQPTRQSSTADAAGSRPSAGARSTLAVCAFLTLVTVVHFREALFLGKVFYICDLGSYYLPVHLENARLRAAGELPIWNEHAFLGYPTQAENEISGFYPPTLIFNVMDDPGYAYTLYVVGHFLLASYGMVLLARTIGVGPVGQTVAALVFVYGGSYLNYVGPLPFATTFAWTPAILALQWRSFERRNWRFAIWGGVLLGAQASGAYPPAMLYQAFLMAAAVLVQVTGPDRRASLFFAVRSTLTIAVVGACLSAPQTFYFLDHASRTIRGSSPRAASDVTPIDFVYGEFWPTRYLLQFVVPDVGWEELSSCRVYFGLLSLCLIGFGLCTRGRSLLPHRITFVTAIVLMLGSWGGLWPLIDELFPFDRIRNPTRFAMIASLAGALLAGVGADRLAMGAIDVGPHWRRFRRAYVGLALALLVGAAATWASGRLLEHDPLGVRLVSTLEPSTLAVRALTAAGLAALCALLWKYFAVETGHRRRAFALVGVVAVDLLIANDAVNPLGPPDLYDAAPRLVASLKRDDEPWRIGRIWENRLREECWPRPALLPGNMAAMFDIDGVNANIAAPLTSMDPVANRDETNGILAFTVKELSLFNVKYLLVPEPYCRDPIDVLKRKTGDHAKKLVAIRESMEPEMRPELESCLFTNPDCRPRIDFRTDISMVPNVAGFDQVRCAINSDAFSLTDSVTIDAEPEFVEGDLSAATIDRLAIRIRAYESQRLAFDVDVPESGILVVNDLHYPGWRATSNGRPVTIHRANWLVRGLALGPGRHRMEFVYRPAPVIVGCYAAGAMSSILLVLGIVQMVQVIRRKRAPLAARNLALDPTPHRAGGPLPTP